VAVGTASQSNYFNQYLSKTNLIIVLIMSYMVVVVVVGARILTQYFAVGKLRFFCLVSVDYVLMFLVKENTCLFLLMTG
jgi:hypothetical protein